MNDLDRMKELIHTLNKDPPYKPYHREADYGRICGTDRDEIHRDKGKAHPYIPD